RRGRGEHHLRPESRTARALHHAGAARLADPGGPARPARGDTCAFHRRAGPGHPRPAGGGFHLQSSPGAARRIAMRLVTYSWKGQAALGALWAERVVDLRRAHAAALRHWGDADELAVADLRVPGDLLGLLRGGETSMAA